jgi:hypothetical protein
MFSVKTAVFLGTPRILLKQNQNLKCSTGSLASEKICWMRIPGNGIENMSIYIPSMISFSKNGISTNCHCKERDDIYPLVNVYVTMENHHV